VADDLARNGRDVVVVTKDLPLRLKASLLGVGADEYRNEQAAGSEWTGVVDLECDSDTIDTLYSDGVVDLVETGELPCHTGLVLSDGSHSALARLHPDKRVHLVDGRQQRFGMTGRSAEQRIALDLLDDPQIGIVSLGGAAGTASRCWPSLPDSKPWSSARPIDASSSSVRSTP